ncbi:sugar transferase [Sphingomonas carotinifaciens]|uniref:sugar transferase n=1 Tax=Sphingomonas carotinifaciens TaxID=1166323 RepID=UPI0039A3859C
MTHHAQQAFPAAPPPQASRWQPPAATLRARVFCGLVALDAACLVLGFALAAWAREAQPGTTHWAFIVAAVLPLYMFTAFYMHAYDARNLQEPSRAAIKGVQTAAVAVCAVILVAFCFRATDHFSRLVVSIGTAATLVMVGISRYLFVRNMPALVGGRPFNVMLLHDGRVPLPTHDFSMILNAADGFDPDRHDPMMYDRLAETLSGADRVIVACAPEQRTAWAHALKGANVQAEMFLPELETLAPLGASSYAKTPTVIVAAGPLGLFERFVKRVFDITLSLAAILLLAPLLAMAALAIKYDSPGPVLFKQVRIGRANRMFRIWKFRSMRVEGCDSAGARSASRDDDRITRIGAILRKTSVDELPQLFNVLKGDMSIVGPRPHALGSRAAEKLFWEVDGRYWHRHAAKPGLTGLAQVRGYRGATIIEDDLKNRLQADLEYLERWSIWRDLKIIAMTFRVVLHRNAF